MWRLPCVHLRSQELLIAIVYVYWLFRLVLAVHWPTYISTRPCLPGIDDPIAIHSPKSDLIKTSADAYLTRGRTPCHNVGVTHLS